MTRDEETALWHDDEATTYRLFVHLRAEAEKHGRKAVATPESQPIARVYHTMRAAHYGREALALRALRAKALTLRALKEEGR